MAVDIFLKLSNGIKGESQDATHKDEIDIHSWNWGLSNSGTTHEGGGGGGGKVNVNDITFTKYVDLASNDLIKRCADGSHIDTGRLVVRKAGGGKPVEYFVVDFNMILVSAYTTGASKGDLDRISETVTLNFRKFNITYTLQTEKGGDGTSQSFGWDIAKNETV
ncbi:MAG: Hcp family type VI secretion system effector [Paracoccaceae bacterium]